MRREGEGERWLEQAQEDLKWSRALFEQGAHHLVAFLSQQVAEKGLKALLYYQGQEAVLGHSVERLAMEVAEVFPEVTDKAARWAALDGHYVTSRYPNSLPGSIPARVYSRDTAESALHLAEEVIAFVEQRMERKG